MKIFKRALYALLIVCLAALIAALFFRIYISEHYPKDSVRIVFTDALTEHYRATDDFKVYTQELRTPYDDAKNGSFFADGLYLVPRGENVQVTLRYNTSALETVAEKYEREEPLAPADGLFRYTLTVSYNQDEGGTDYRTYGASYMAESDAFMYHYTKLAFDGVSFEGAAWMRVDIYLADEQEAFGSIIVYEKNFEYGGELYPYEMEEKRISKGDLPA